MGLETKFLRLSKPVEGGAEIDGWQVCWIGGWSKYRIFYMVMVVQCEDAGIKRTATVG
jgi:hypothetical protein